MEITEGAPDWMRRRFAFRRGFLDCLAMQPDHFVERWEQLFRLTPVRRIEIQPYPINYFPRLWDCEGLSRLQRLWIYRSHYTLPQPSALLSSERRALTDLGAPSDLVPHATEMIANAPYAPNLRRLEINARNPDGAVWPVLREASSLGNLKRFGFRSRLPLSAFIDPVRPANPRWFSNLERLELIGTPRREPFVLPGVRPLLDSGPLRALALEGCGFSASEPSALGSMPRVALEHLDLGSGCGIGRETLRALIRSPGLAGLRSFTLSGNGNAALTYLRDAPMRESLRVLRLSGCQPSGILALATTGCPRLAVLDIRLRTGGADRARLVRAVDAVLDPARFPRLVSLTIRTYETIHLDVFKRLIENEAVTRLRELALLFQIGHLKLRALAGAGSLHLLDRLQIPEHYLVTAAGTEPADWARVREERKKAIAVLQERFGVRYDSLQ